MCGAPVSGMEYDNVRRLLRVEGSFPVLRIVFPSSTHEIATRGLHDEQPSHKCHASVSLHAHRDHVRLTLPTRPPSPATACWAARRSLRLLCFHCGDLTLEVHFL